MDFKQPLSVCDQTKYLSENKRVVYNNMSESDAQEILYKCNYINVITPFKYRFARKNKKGGVQKDVYGNHIYDRDVDFKEYYDLYLAERNKYPIIYKHIMEFETLLNSIISHECMCKFNICSTDSFKVFTEMLKATINTSSFRDSVKERMHETVDNLLNYILEYNNPYIVFDNLTLNEILIVLVGLDNETQSKCISQILKRQHLIKSDDINTFYSQVSRLVKIRNCVCHNDSIEILLLFLSRKHKSLRSSSDKYSYAKLIEKLSETPDNEK